MPASVVTTVSQVRMYHTEEFPCAYLPGQMAAMQALDPRIDLNQKLYSQLIHSGFRRSGEQVYKPHCHSCQACIPLRIPVDRFQPSRSQRRVWRRNQDLRVHVAETGYSDEYFDLFRRYVNDKHRDGGMDKPRVEDYLGFLLADGIATSFIEFRQRQRLIAVAVTDRLDDGLSAVYTFYDMAAAQRSLGVYTLLWQIEHCRQLELQRLYLGYWIEACRKMRYKQRYRPCEILTAAGWQVLS